MIAINSLGNESVKGLFIFIQNYASDIVRVVNSSQFCILYHIVPKKNLYAFGFFKKKTSVGSISSKVFFIENRKSSTPSIFFEEKEIKLRVEVK